MSELDLFSMFMLGLLGTGHCAGMCGPLVLAFPAQTGRFFSHILYHTGRIGTYVLLGAVVGAVGEALIKTAGGAGVESLAWIARAQVGFSLLAAVFLLMYGLSNLGLIREPSWMSVASPSRVPGYAKVLEMAAVEQKPHGMLLLGFMMGFLPCGLSYAAFARALPAGGPAEAGLLVLAFGLGTLPGLLVIGTGASRLSTRFRRHSQILAALLMIGMSASLIIGALQALMS